MNDLGFRGAGHFLTLQQFVETDMLDTVQVVPDSKPVDANR
jgi:hypothetical protein